MKMIPIVGSLHPETGFAMTVFGERREARPRGFPPLHFHVVIARESSTEAIHHTVKP